MKLKKNNNLSEYLNQTGKIITSLSPTTKRNITKISDLALKSIKSQNKVIFCGNGGSASMSEHLAAEFVGRFNKNRNSFPAISLTSNSANVTAIANDFGFDQIFRRQIEGLGNSGDLLICMSTSGRSKNIWEAIKIAKRKKITTVLFTGNINILNDYLPDFLIKVPSNINSIIQEVHLSIGHYICQYVENNYHE